MANRIAYLFTGQGGFESSNLHNLKFNQFIDENVKKIYCDIFQSKLPDFDSLTEDEIKKNEISALILINSIYWHLDRIDSKPNFLAGYSVGQYLALHCAGILDRNSTTQLIFNRCKIMNEASKAISGSMYSILGMKLEDAEEMCRSFGGNNSIAISNDNAPGNLTISGKENIMKLVIKKIETYQKFKIKRVQTSGAWHSNLLISARSKLELELSKYTFNDSEIIVIENVNAEKLLKNDLRKNLVYHLTSRVRWR